MRGFELIKTANKLDSSQKARLGLFHTSHGTFETPAFMPVGTQGTVKGVNPGELKQLGAQIILSNTYHLHLQPGDELIKKFGGLHKFMGWDGPILTDSGGYQIFSLSSLREISANGVSFKSHRDGQKFFLTPEKVIEIQENLGVDICMVLDECLPYPASEEQAQASLKITLDWAKKSKLAKKSEENFVFGIVQGGMYKNLRQQAVEELIKIDFDSYAIGGLSVGEPTELLDEMCEFTAQLLPENKLRYLMGVGTPRDIVTSVENGIDLFDCVIPTRNARFGRIYVGAGFINIKNSQYRDDQSPLEEDCECYTCKNFSKAYLAHLIRSGEILYSQLSSIHNLFFYQKLMRNIREAIRKDNFANFAKLYKNTQ